MGHYDEQRYEVEHEPYHTQWWAKPKIRWNNSLVAFVCKGEGYTSTGLNIENAYYSWVNLRDFKISQRHLYRGAE